MKNIQKQFIMAMKGAGKTTASKAHPDIIADVDWAYFVKLRQLNGKETRHPDFPVNFVQSLIKAYNTHPVVVTSMGHPPCNLIKLIRSEICNASIVKDYLRECVSSVANQNDESTATPEFENDIERLAELIMPELRTLRRIEFESILTIPDEECCQDFINRQKHREEEYARRKETDPNAKRTGGRFRGDDAVVESFYRNTNLANKLFKETGLFSKLPMRKGQHFLDAFRERDRTIEKPMPRDSILNETPK